LTNFNISVAATDAFMEAVKTDGLYRLQFEGRSYGDVRALDVWGPMMDGNWDNGEPGILFIDRINATNPLRYCETIKATNPCAEQPLPPNGACLLGSVNILKLLKPAYDSDGIRLAFASGTQTKKYAIDFDLLRHAVDAAVRAFDNVIDRTIYPLPAQEGEAKAKRRMGVGATGLANAIETVGHPFGTPDYIKLQNEILREIAVQAYRTSCKLAILKGPFPLWDRDKYCEGAFFKRLPEDLQALIRANGLRNGLLTSIAPTGTISLAADNISGGIEPVFQERYNRLIKTPTGDKEFEIIDAAFSQYGTRARPAQEVTPMEHVAVLCAAQHWVDSSISKTINVAGQVGGEGPGTTFREFQDVYMACYEGGAKGCATFNSNGKRAGILRPADTVDEIGAGAACVFDPVTGMKDCG
jgi:ribonucleoside-diphosphate reductase alpha chain